jgi:CO/xanthine dehydrogenase Mo-binding subunit
LGARADAVDIINADTDLCPYDAGTFASTGTVVAGQAVELTAKTLRDTSSSSQAAIRASTRSPAGSKTQR